jgi:hypothetical protein
MDFKGGGGDGACWDDIAIVLSIEVQLFWELSCMGQKWGMVIMENFWVIKSHAF